MSKVALQVLEDFAEVGAHDRITERRSGVFRQWSTPDIERAAYATKNALRATERYRTDPAVKLAQAQRHRERMTTDPRYVGRRRQQNRRRGMQEKLPETRAGISHHFEIFDSQGRTTDGYLTTGVYPDGRVGEVFIKIAKGGDAMGPLLDQWAICFSVALQYGAPLRELCEKFKGSRFEPAGATQNKAIPRTSSPVDYVCRFLLKIYCPEPPAVEAPEVTP